MRFLDGYGPWLKRMDLAEAEGAPAVEALLSDLRKADETAAILMAIRRCLKYLGRDEELDSVNQKLVRLHEKFDVAVADLSPRERVARATELKLSTGTRHLGPVHSWNEPFEASLQKAILCLIDSISRSLEVDDFYRRLRVTGLIGSLATLIHVAASTGVESGFWETDDRLSRLLLRGLDSLTPTERDRHLLAAYAMVFEGLSEDDRDRIRTWRDG